MIFAWVIVLAGAAVGTFVLIAGFTTANGAPQEATAAALALACVVIPYCAVRAIEGIANAAKASKSKPVSTFERCPSCKALIDRRQSIKHCGECGGAL